MKERRNNMAYEPFMVNPHRKKRRSRRKRSPAFKSKATKRRRKNAMAMVVGNPRKKGGVTRMAKRRRSKKNLNPRRRRIFRGTLRRRKNPILKRRRGSGRRRNPVMSTVRSQVGKLSTIFIGAISAIATTAVPGLLRAESTFAKYGSQIATVIVGSMLIGKFMRDSQKGFVWGLVGGSVILAEVLKTYVLKGLLPGLGRTGQYYYLPAPTSPMSYIPPLERDLIPSGPF